MQLVSLMKIGIWVYRRGNLYLGLCLGLIGPLLGALVFYLLKFSEMPFSDFVSNALDPRMAGPLLSFGGLVNLIFFFLFIWRKKDLSARGVLLATFIYVLIVVILKVL